MDQSANMGGAVRLRVFFPETWMWDEVTTDANGKTDIQLTAPDTITTWELHAIAISPSDGLGLWQGSLRVFQPFFASIDLPIAAKRNEQLPISVAVYNYLSTVIKVSVTLEGTTDFVIVPNGAEGKKTFTAKDAKSKEETIPNLTIQPGNIGVAKYTIQPLTLGEIPITVVVRGTTKSDALQRKLLVRPEGSPQEYVVNSMIDTLNTGNFTDILPIKLPTSGLIPGSVRAFFTLTGDLMGQAMQNLDQLVSMPFGCGEQTMVTFSPSIFVLRYLSDTGQSKPELEQRARTSVLKGYQRELTFIHSDNSFSAFGKSDPEGSSWLTAFVLKCFAQARPYTHIDPQVLNAIKDYLHGIQDASGVFPQRGQVLHTELYGGVSGPTKNTAFTLISLVEADMIDSSATKAVNYLKSQVSSSMDVYSLAIIGYALALADNATAGIDPAMDPIINTIMQQLNAQAIRNEQGVHWSDKPRSVNPGIPHAEPALDVICRWCQPMSTSAEIEITSYVLLLNIVRGQLADAAEIARWLSLQRNPMGGYRSTQDTVLGLQSLAEYSAAIRSTNTNLNVILSSQTGNLGQWSVNSDNMDILQSAMLTIPASGNLTLSATGIGKAQAQLLIRFNVEEDLKPPAFNFSVVYTLSGPSRMNVRVCAMFTPLTLTSAGMSIIDVGLFTGWVADRNSLDKLQQDQVIKRYEIDDTGVHLYLDDITSKQNCFSFIVTQQQIVFFPQATQSSVYSYYSPELRASILTDFNTATKKNSKCTNLSTEDRTILAVILGFTGFVGILIFGWFAYTACFVAQYRKHVDLPGQKTIEEAPIVWHNSQKFQTPGDRGSLPASTVSDDKPVISDDQPVTTTPTEA